MNKLFGSINRFIKEEEGVTMVEYGLLASLIAIVCIGAIATVGTDLQSTFNKVATCLATPSATCASSS